MKPLSELLIPDGAILTTPDGYRTVLADIAWQGNTLWWYEAFGGEHILEADRVDGDGYWTSVYSGPTRVALIGGSEGGEDTAVWKAWQEHLNTDEGRAAAPAIAQMKHAALNWKAD